MDMTYRVSLASVGQMVDDQIAAQAAQIDSVTMALSAKTAALESCVADTARLSDQVASLIDSNDALHKELDTALATPAPSIVRLAGFYKPIAGLPADVPLVILTHNDETARDAMPAQYGRRLMCYIVGCECEGPTACPAPAGYKPLGNNAAYKGDFCAAVQPNEGWFLHNSKGVRIRGGSAGDTRLMYHMNPGHPGWQQFIAARIQYLIATYGWPAIFLDNVELTAQKTKVDSFNSDGTIKEYPTDLAWKTAWIGYLKAVSDACHALGAPVYGNMIGDPNDGTSWDDYLPYLDGGMFEGWGGYKPLSVSSLRGQLQQASRAIDRGKTIICVGQGAATDRDKMISTFAQYLLIADGRLAHYRSTASAAYLTWRDDPLFHAVYGAPQGPYSEIAAGVFRRQFTRATVTLDGNTHVGTIALV